MVDFNDVDNICGVVDVNSDNSVIVVDITCVDFTDVEVDRFVVSNSFVLVVVCGDGREVKL